MFFFVRIFQRRHPNQNLLLFLAYVYANHESRASFNWQQGAAVITVCVAIQFTHLFLPAELFLRPNEWCGSYLPAGRRNRSELVGFECLAQYRPDPATPVLTGCCCCWRAWPAWWPPWPARTGGPPSPSSHSQRSSQTSGGT